MADPAPIPVNLITGPLGVGKTTAIARLLADKPRDQGWLVVLNEFTDTGIDVVTLAAAARGAYDLRMIPGGCLCCTGEADFRRQLSALLAEDSARWPSRILIEPSGIGHPGALVEELRLFERSGALRLESTIALVDVQRSGAGGLQDEIVAAQIAAADVLLLSKADLASGLEREQFLHWAGSLFPNPRLVGLSMHGVLPPQALQPPPASFEFELRSRSSPSGGIHEHNHEQEHEHAPFITHREMRWLDVSVLVNQHYLLGRHACGWVIGSGVLFDAGRLQAWLADKVHWQGVERFKAVLRTGVEQWHLLQRWQDQFAVQPCAWRQDSRIEVQLQPGAIPDWSAWEAAWQPMLERCPVA